MKTIIVIIGVIVVMAVAASAITMWAIAQCHGIHKKGK